MSGKALVGAAGDGPLGVGVGVGDTGDTGDGVGEGGGVGAGEGDGEGEGSSGGGGTGDDGAPPPSAAAVAGVVATSPGPSSEVPSGAASAFATSVPAVAAVAPAGAPTVSVHTCDGIVPTMAWILTLPGPIAVTCPELLILATLWLLVFQAVTVSPCELGNAATEPSEYKPYAVNCKVLPAARVFALPLASRYALDRVGPDPPGGATLVPATVAVTIWLGT